MLKKILLFALVASVVAALVKKIKDASDERELWHEATTAPDYR